MEDNEMKITKDEFKELVEVYEEVNDLYTEIYLNSATIKGCPFFRTRKDSDVILSHGMHKKLRKLFGEKSIHPELRARIPLLCDADGILWAPFCALRDGAKHKQSECDLKISLFINDFD
jgi:tRNA(Ile)-lysidine synthetase-like protein